MNAKVPGSGTTRATQFAYCSFIGRKRVFNQSRAIPARIRASNIQGMSIHVVIEVQSIQANTRLLTFVQSVLARFDIFIKITGLGNHRNRKQSRVNLGDAANGKSAEFTLNGMSADTRPSSRGKLFAIGKGEN